MTPSPSSSPCAEVRPQMSVEDFEELARKAPETVLLEFINGKLEVKPLPDQLHGAIAMWLLRQCMQQRPELALYPEQGLKVETYRNGRARADGALAPLDHFVGQVGEWAGPDGVLMTVEVTSHDHDTDRRDRIEKRDGYAAADIPVYLLIDRDAEELVLYADPRKGKYQTRTTHPYGSTVKLPDPVGITLETEKLKDYTP
ncbi:Uma2 family endonuclease [Streptomyces sp. 35G-GA-8]|uniref:Uma2 family endonuclease n=1 Tax=Streptomyces sp. 35G-GA-8 TaxID=2939434 RepID=UPI00201F2606|nr:Uma2 family endonuclease [Streptomyces sp. 35G-GA-8]MCL7380234.1 Uma2 family endonuclease [Streptomyces sp. 35G-GA-8]